MHLHPQIQNPSAFPEEEPSLKVFLFKSINQSKYCFLMGRISNFSILIDFYALTDFYSKVRLCSNKKQSALFSISISNIEFDIKSQTPYWSVLGFWKIEFEKSSLTNWISNLQKSISNLIFAGYTGSKNPVRNTLKMQFVALDFSYLSFQKSSTDE